MAGSNLTKVNTRKKQSSQYLNPDLSESWICPIVLARRVWRIFCGQKHSFTLGWHTHNTQTKTVCSAAHDRHH